MGMRVVTTVLVTIAVVVLVIVVAISGGAGGDSSGTKSGNESLHIAVSGNSFSDSEFNGDKILRHSAFNCI